MKIIEFFGPPCCGKTYVCNYLKKKNKSIILSNYLIHEYAKNFIKLSYIEKISLKYMLFVKNFKKFSVKKTKNLNSNLRKLKINKKNFNNKYSIYLFNKYLLVSKKIFFLYKRKNPLLVNFVSREINQIKDKDKKLIFKRWFIELFAQFYIAKKLKSNKIILFDEGFLQRSLFLVNKNKINKIKLLKYLNLIDRADYYIYLDKKSDILSKRSISRQKSEKNVFIYRDKKQINKYKTIFKNILKNMEK